MPDLEEIYSKLGSGFCRVKEGKLLESYLLSDAEIEMIGKMLPVTEHLPQDLEVGILEFDINSRFAIFKIEDHFLVFPVKTDNFSEIMKKKGAFYET